MRPRLGMRVRQLPQATRRSLRHPRWMIEHLRMVGYRRADRKRPFDPRAHQDLLGTEEEVVCSALGVDSRAYRAARERFWAPQMKGDDPAPWWNARPSLQSFVSVCVHLVRPERMVETGVARGYSTAIILHAMHELSRGHLYSVELPTLDLEGQPGVGAVVPEELKDRWTLCLGPSSAVLPRLLAELGSIDIFLHDSDHTYRSQTMEYRAAWPTIRSGGLLISDDVQNPALLDFSRDVGVAPRLIADQHIPDPIGVLVKP